MNQIKNRFSGDIITESEEKPIHILAVEFYKKLSGADLSGADLSGANLSSADLSSANLRCANLRCANLSDADLRCADLRCANLSSANLSGADLSSANLSSANLSDADLSGAKGLLTAAEFLSQFESDKLGIIVYKKIGDTSYGIASHWKIEVGEFLTEVVNPNRQNNCGCGVNFATLEWCKREYKNADLWKCRIRFIDLADVVVPFHTDGKARCARLELLEKVK